MAASNASASPSATADRELIFTRVFDAPRDLVFEAWTNPAHVAKWWGPNGFATTISQMEVRPGGVWRLVMRGPDGRDYHNRIVFLEVVRPERLVYKHEPEKGTEPVSFETTLTLAEEGSKTRLAMRMLFPSAAMLRQVAEKYGAVEGANQTLERLAGHLPRMASGREVVLSRVYDAPRDLVFKAWTEPERLKRWWGPASFTNPVCEAEARPGGAIRIHMLAPDGVVYPMTGVYREVAAPERLVFTSSALDAAGEPLFEVLNTVTFDDEGGKTRLTVHASVTKESAGAARYFGGAPVGWSQSLDRLAREVAQ